MRDVVRFVFSAHALQRFGLMHQVPFTIKHAHFVSQGVLSGFASKENLTPARFDMMFLLHSTRYRQPFQTLLAKWLGVSGATICKMIRAMREAGMLRLTRDPEDRRFKRISLTKSGRRAFARLLRHCRRGRVAAAIRAAWKAACLSRAEVRMCVFEIIDRVARFNRGLDDHTELHGYWHFTR